MTSHAHPLALWPRATVALKGALFPGVNLHARERYIRLPTMFGPEIGPGTNVLDAGCGNGMLSFQAWKRGATVVGISIKQHEIDGCRAMFNHSRGIPDGRLRFLGENLYEMHGSGGQFDAIICTEVLEHLRDDGSVCRKFFELLKPGGCVHVTSPNADHPYNQSFPLDAEERGGHVRAGYTSRTYRQLFEPLGFVVEELCGLGGPVRQAFNWRIKEVQKKVGPAVGVPLFLASLPFLWLDSPSPKVPFSLYARARKPGVRP